MGFIKNVIKFSRNKISKEISLKNRLNIFKKSNTKENYPSVEPWKRPESKNLGNIIKSSSALLRRYNMRQGLAVILEQYPDLKIFQ